MKIEEYLIAYHWKIDMKRYLKTKNYFNDDIKKVLLNIISNSKTENLPWLNEVKMKQLFSFKEALEIYESHPSMLKELTYENQWDITKSNYKTRDLLAKAVQKNPLFIKVATPTNKYFERYHKEAAKMDNNFYEDFGFLNEKKLIEYILSTTNSERESYVKDLFSLQKDGLIISIMEQNIDKLDFFFKERSVMETVGKNNYQKNKNKRAFINAAFIGKFRGWISDDATFNFFNVKINNKNLSRRMGKELQMKIVKDYPQYIKYISNINDYPEIKKEIQKIKEETKKGDKK